MARTSSSLDLTEFFNNDDSEGLRLAEFLHQRRGGVQRQNFLFINSEPQRMSLNVQLEKIPPIEEQHPAANNEEGISNNNRETVTNKKAEEKRNAKTIQNAKQSEDKIIVGEHHELDAVPNGVCGPVEEHPSSSNKSEKILINGSCNKAVSPEQSENIKASSVPMMRPLRPYSPFKAISPVRSIIRKSGRVVSSSDRLRRITLNRLSNIGVSRRTLLDEFEETVSGTNFDPPLSSTPFSEPPLNKLRSLPIPSPSPDSENVMPNTTENHNADINDPCSHTDTLIRSLQRKEEELKNYMNKIMEINVSEIQSQSQIDKANYTEKEKESANSLNATKSPLKRTYTVQKDLTGHVILTPEKISKIGNLESSRQLRLRTTSAQNKILLKSEEQRNNTIVQTTSPVKNCSGGTNIMLSTSQRRDCPSGKKPDQEIINSPPPNNVSIVFPTQDAIDMPAEKNNTIEIHSNNKEMSMIVIPVTQNFNGTYKDENLVKKKTTAKTETNKDRVICELNDFNDDNLKLTDIITDDEEETPKAAMTQRSIENSQAPLNLAPSATSIRTRRLRKRSIPRRRLQMENSQFVNAAVETEQPPPAHSNNNSINRKRINRRRQIPLNKAPGIPLNGEQFAKELARMSNYEILDLRKRNSLGKVFPISGRKFTRGLENAVKKQKELDDQIEMELLRRNFQEDSNRQRSDANVENATEGEELQNSVDEDYLLAPDKFRDSLVRQQKEGFRESSFVDEKSTDRISFSNKRKSLNEKKIKKGKGKEIPELLKHYLEVSELITKKKKRAHSKNQTKRSLYSEEIAVSSDKNSSPENSFEEIKTNSMRTKKDSIQCVPSPPKSNKNEITIIKIVSPPPPITPLAVSLPREQEVQQVSPISERENEPLPPPPPEFDNDLGDRSNNFSSCSTSINTKQSVQLTDSNKKNDDEIFKKPMQPPPKRRGRKPNTMKFPLNELLQTTTIGDKQQLDKSADEADNTLRRSKRGQVPLENPCPLIKMIMEKNLEKQRVEQNQKDKRKHLQKAKAESDEIIKSKSSVKPKRTRNKKSALPAIPENEQLVVPLYQNEKTAKKKSTNENKAKVRRKHDNKKLSNISANEAFERSHLTLTNPPPLDHLNSVFEQLRNSSSSVNLSSQSSSQPTTNQSNQTIPSKIKPLRVRIARLKSFTQKNTATAEVSETNNTRSKRESRRKSPSPAYSTQSQGSSMTANNDSNHELILWLKNISECNSMTERNDTIFKEMRISAAANLSFTELQGVEYAFYDTDQKASLGYLRFKPRQIKPKKRAKLFHLHFITLVGKFRIKANNEESILNVGDMVAIDKFVYYYIENLTDNIGILMVIKK